MGSEIYKWEINFFLLLIYLGGEECLSTPLDLEKICAEVMSAKSPCLVGISDDAGRYNIEQKLVIFFLFLSSFKIINLKWRVTFFHFNFSGFSVNISTTRLCLSGKAPALLFMFLALTLLTAWRNWLKLWDLWS